MKLRNSILYQLFCSLSIEELKELDKAVHSPFFNYREEEIRLFEYLLKARKSTQDILNEEAVLTYLFPKQKHDTAKLRHVMTYLSRIINRYLVIHEMEESEEQRQLLLARSLRKRNLGKLFLSNYEEAKRYYAEEAPASPSLYYNQLQLHNEYYTYSTTNRRTKSEELKGLSDDLDTFYVLQKLKQACSILSYKNIFKFEYQPDDMEEILALVKRKDLLSNQLASLLYFNYLCLSQPDKEEHFEHLHKALLSDSLRIDLKELKDIFTLAINYCIKRLNTGGQKYFTKVFALYQAGLKTGVFEEEGKLSPFTYKNIAAIGIGLKEYKWVAMFLETYKEKLEQNIRDGFYAYCMARYYFAKADYNRVTDLLQAVEIKEQFTDLDARVLLIKTYYELSEYNLMSYSIENLKQQLKRKKLQTYHETVYKNFAKKVSQLSHLRQYDKKAKDAFVAKLAATQPIAEKEWLTSKVKP